MLYVKLVGCILLLCLGLYGYNLLTEKDDLIKSQSRELTLLKSQTSSKATVTERIIREPGGRIIEEREKIVERTQVLTQTADKTVSKSEPNKEPANGKRYSLGIQYRYRPDDSWGNYSELLRLPILEVGRRIGSSNFWGTGSYDLRDKAYAIGLRLEF